MRYVNTPKSPDSHKPISIKAGVLTIPLRQRQNWVKNRTESIVNSTTKKSSSRPQEAPLSDSKSIKAPSNNKILALTAATAIALLQACGYQSEQEINEENRASAQSMINSNDQDVYYIDNDAAENGSNGSTNNSEDIEQQKIPLINENLLAVSQLDENAPWQVTGVINKDSEEWANLKKFWVTIWYTGNEQTPVLYNEEIPIDQSGKFSIIFPTNSDKENQKINWEVFDENNDILLSGPLH
jgi:hypothetical protein